MAIRLASQYRLIKYCFVLKLLHAYMHVAKEETVSLRTSNCTGCPSPFFREKGLGMERLCLFHGIVCFAHRWLRSEFHKLPPGLFEMMFSFRFW